MGIPERERQRGDPVATLLTRIVLFHYGALALFLPWAFGGQAPWARTAILGWGSIGIALFLAISLSRPKSRDALPPAFRLLWPLWLFDILVIASTFNPSFREASVGADTVLVMVDPRPGFPSSALPSVSLRELWQFNGLVLSAFNLFLVLNRRQQIRQVLFLIAGNALVLAVLGTFQKLAGSPGLWFGKVKSPNEHFFATFIYHNHWGAYVVLCTGICLALLFHYHRRGGYRDLVHSPLMLGAIVTLLLAISIPLSTSRSCTVLAAVLLAGALIHLLVRVIRRRREQGRSAMAPVAGIVAAALLAVVAVGYLGRNVIAQRAQLTSQQLSQLAEERTLTSRLVLYRDTWHMAQQKPWFGWGLESYGRVFRIFNTQRATESWVWIPYYAEAHNDWFQSLAETGFVGTGLLVALGLLPLLGHFRRIARSPVPRYLLSGGALILLYAFLEFPFANPAVLFLFCSCWYLAARHLDLDRANE